MVANDNEWITANKWLTVIIQNTDTIACY